MASGWRQELREKTGRNSTIAERRDAKDAYVSEAAVNARMGEGAYEALRKQEIQKQFGTNGYDNGSEREKRRFDRRFNRRLRNDRLTLSPKPSVIESVAPPAAPPALDKNYIYPLNFSTYQIRPIGGSFLQFPIRTSLFSRIGTGVEAEAEAEAAYEALQNQLSNKIYKPAVLIDDKSYQLQVNSSDVANIQRNLGVPVTGKWDDSTTEAVKTWQSNNGLELTGIWDQATINAHNDILQKNKEILRQSNLRNRLGFVDENAVKEWLIANGLEGTGQLDQNSIGKWNELSRPTSNSNTQSNLFVGEKSYMTEQDARYAFANLYNKYLGDRGLSRTNYFSNLGYSNATKELDGYNEAWNQFISQYDNHEHSGIFGKKYTLKEKQGGKMRISYFQQGGTMNQQQDIQQQIMKLVQEAILGNQEAIDKINQIEQAAQQGDPQAAQLKQMIQQVVEQMKGQATSAKWGSKLQYIKSLKYAKGGKTCPSCQNGGIPNNTKNNPDKLKNKIEEKACGGKTKKKYFGGWI